MTGFPARSPRDRYWSGVTRNLKPGAAVPGARTLAIVSSLRRFKGTPVGSRSGADFDNRLRQPPWDGYLTKGLHRLDGGQDSPVLFGRGVRARLPSFNVQIGRATPSIRRHFCSRYAIAI